MKILIKKLKTEVPLFKFPSNNVLKINVEQFSSNFRRCLYFNRVSKISNELLQLAVKGIFKIKKSIA